MNDADVDELGPVDYLVVEFPADKANFSGEMATELSALVERGLVRVLDLLFLKKDLDGSVEGFESHEFDAGDVGELRALEGELAMLLAAEDVEAIGAALEPGSVAGVLVWENAWAAPFGSAVRRSGGQLVASGRIPIQALAAAVEADETTTSEEPEMLGRGRVGRPGVIGGPVARTAAVAGTAAVVTRGVRRRGDRRDDRRDDRQERRPFR